MEFKFLTGLFTRPKGSGSASVEHATSSSIASSSGAATSVFDQSRGGWDIDRAVSEGLERVIWIYRCVDAISANFSSLIMNGIKGDPHDGEMYDLERELFRLLNRKPNDYETANLFKYRLSSQVLLSKRGAFIELEGNKAGGLKGMHLLPAGQVEPIPHPKKFVDGYRVKKAGGAGEDTLPTEKVIWVRTRPHPIDPYMQITPLSAAGIVAETDFLARLFNRNFLMNDGRPTTLVTVQGELDDDQAEEIKLRFSGGPMYAGRTTVIEADGISVADLSASPRDVQWLEALRASKEDILLAFGVPESVLGNASGRTFDNADAEREGFWKDTMVPHCDAISRALDPLTGDVNDDNYIAPDYSKIDVLQRQKRAREEAAMAKWEKGIITLDELRKELGYKELNLPGSRAHILTGGVVITPETEYEAIRAIPVIGQPAEPDPAAAAMEGATQGALAGRTELDNILSARMTRFLGGQTPMLNAPKELPAGIDPNMVIEGEVGGSTGKGVEPRPSRGVLEGQIHGVVSTWCNEQARTLVGRLDHAKCRKYTRHWDGPGSGTKAIDPSYVVQTSRWANNLSTDLRGVVEPVLMREMNRAADGMANSGFVGMMRARGMTQRTTGSNAVQVYGSPSSLQKASASILDGLMGVAEKAAARQSERVAARIKEMDAEGASLKDIKREVERMVGERSSWRRNLSTYLTTAAVEAAAHETWGKAGPLVSKVWNTTGDEHVRPSHRKVDGTTKSMNIRFRVGKSSLSFPGDWTGDPSETANCRCYLDYVVADRFADAYDAEAS